MVNYGLLAASLLLVVGAVWLAVAFLAARSDLQRASRTALRPTEALAQAGIAAQQARGDEVLNLISRSGDATFVQNFQAVRTRTRPGHRAPCSARRRPRHGRRRGRGRPRPRRATPAVVRGQRAGVPA